MTFYPRLHVDEPDPPAPIPFDAARAAPGRADDRRDAADDALRALDRAQRALDELSRLNDEAPIPFRAPDDDGPRAA